MKAERWQEIEQVFHAALQREPVQRPAFLAQICAGDEWLYGEVKSLITSYEEGDSFLDASASPLAAEMFGDRVGKTIGPYQVLSVLGAGGMGTVYLAQDERLGRRIALKLLPAQFTNDKDRLRRFQQEARAASALNHPNILTVHEIAQNADLHYIATEFIDGMTLRQQMAHRAMNLGEALNVAIQVASALEAAHTAGIVHRDIKPENVMIRADGYVKVLDFGLAKLAELPATTLEAALSGFHTDPGMVMGTPRYMSPEQARGLAVDARADVFSLGVMIYEMVAGKVPFDGATPSDVIAAILKDEPEPLTTYMMEVPDELEWIVKRALAKNCNDRYQTVKAMSADLQHLKEEIQLNAKLGRISSATHGRTSDVNSEDVTMLAPGSFKSTSANAVMETESVVPAITRQRWAALSGLAALLLLVGLISVVSLNRRKNETTPPKPSSRPLTFRPGYITAARFAPDGKTVIYGAGFDGKPLELFTTDVEGSESRAFGIPSAGIKSISKTGEMAVLLNSELSWAESRNGTLALVPLTGGPPRVLMEGVDEADWAPDGKSLAITRAEAGEHQLEYPIGNVLYRSSGWISYPRISPQGDKIAFLEHPIGDDSGSVAVLDLKTKNKSLVSSGWKALKGLAWFPGADEIWFSGSRTSKKQNIYAVTVSGREQTIFEGQVYVRLEDIYSDGRLLVAHGNPSSRIVVLSGNSTIDTVVTPFAWSTSADLSADGKTLLFYEWGHALDAASVYLRKLDDSEAVRLGGGKALALSPDVKWALAVQEKSPPQLVLLPTGGGEPRALPNNGIKEYHYASWFPDGRQILFTAIEARDDAFIRSYVQDTETGEVRPITEEGTVALRVSPDAKSIVALDPDGRYYIHPLDGTAPSLVPGLESDDEPIQWSADGRALYVRGPGDYQTKIYRVDITNGRRRLLKNIVPSNSVGLIGLEAKPGGILITPDGNSCVYTYWTVLQELMLMNGLR